MKKILFTLLMTMAAMAVTAKDWKTVVVTTQPQMHCEGCENKIKGNLKFEKGIKNVETNVAEQRVTIQFDAKKTSEKTILDAFRKFGYEASIVTDCCEPTSEPTVAPSCCETQAAPADGGCCKK